jgi:peptide/nickel transport system substrate-binding protein
MERPNQSFQVIDSQTIQLNQGYGYLGHVAYPFLLATLSSPLGSAVDPIVIRAHGGVTNNTNDWMSTNTLGTGQYLLAAYTAATGYTLRPDPNYWGKAAAAAEPQNNMIQPARSSIEVDFQPNTILTAQDLKTGSVAGGSFAYLGPSTVNDLKNSRCVSVKATDIVYGSTAGGWWIYMNQKTQPFTDIHVRKAVVHAINYDRIISQAFGGYAQRWVGPVPPGYQYYNPDNLAPYPYNLTLARQEMNLSAWPRGYPHTLNYLYINSGDWVEVASLLKDDLSKIGITINPVGLPLDTLIAEEQAKDPSTGECISQTSQNGGPFPIGQEFYTSDYISPDDWTQNDIVSSGSANMCMAAYSNVTADSLVYDAAARSDPAGLRLDYAQMTSLMYDNYTVAWLVVPNQFQVTNPLLKGYVNNPMGAALPFVIAQNTMYASP